MNAKPPRVSDHLANERTFLAWLRTAISMMGFGAVIVRLREVAPPSALHASLHTVHLGLLFIVIGVAMIPFALWNWAQTRRAIDSDEYRPAFWGMLIFAVVLGLAIVAYLGLTARQTSSLPLGALSCLPPRGFMG